MNQNSKIQSRIPREVLHTRKRTLDSPACDQNVRKGRAMKVAVDALANKTMKDPTHIGVRRYLMATSVGLFRKSLAEAEQIEAKHNRLPNLDIGKIAVARSMKLDLIPPHKIKDPSYVKGLLDAAAMMRNSADAKSPPLVPVTAEVVRIDMNKKGQILMTLDKNAEDGNDLVNERYFFASKMGDKTVRDAVPATKHITKQTPLVIVAGHYKGDLETLYPEEAQELTSGIYSAMQRAQEDTPNPKPTVQFKPWEFTQAFELAVQACARGMNA